MIYIELYRSRANAPVMHNVNESWQSVLESVLEKLQGKLDGFGKSPDGEVISCAEPIVTWTTSGSMRLMPGIYVSHTIHVYDLLPRWQFAANWSVGHIIKWIFN